MEKFSEVHQRSKIESGGLDSISLILLALNELVSGSTEDELVLATKDIAEKVERIARAEEMSVSATPNSQRIGRLLSQLGFTRHGNHGSARRWHIAGTQLEAQAKSRGLELPQLTSHASSPMDDFPPVE